MPYDWLSHPDTDRTGARLRLWPYRSLPRRGQVLFLGATAVLAAVPLVGALGSPALWFLLPFFAAAVAAVWLALDRSFRDGEIVEDLTLAPGRVTLVRHGPRGLRQAWEADPHWVRPVLHETGGPVPGYLTLQGGPREVELGAFLSEAERRSLHDEVRAALARLR